MDLEIRHLRLLSAVADEASVTRAANRLHVTQSALSHQLRDAEDKLGTPLFHRRNKKMVLTPAGERLLETARQVLGELERAETEIKHGAKGGRGVLRLSTQCYTCYHWLPPRLKLFRRAHPDVEVQICADVTPHPFPALLDGKIDLAIVCLPVRNRKIQYVPLFPDELVVIVPPKHRLASRSYFPLEEFAQENLIVFPPKEESTILTKVLAPARISPASLQQVQLTEAVVEMVKAGLGVSVLAKWAATPYVKAGQLRALPLAPKGMYRQWSAATLRDRTIPEYVQGFVDILIEHPLTRPVWGQARNRKTETTIGFPPKSLVCERLAKPSRELSRSG